MQVFLPSVRSANGALVHTKLINLVRMLLEIPRQYKRYKPINLVKMLLEAESRSRHRTQSFYDIEDCSLCQTVLHRAEVQS